jgi:hypothetical protein
VQLTDILADASTLLAYEEGRGNFIAALRKVLGRAADLDPPERPPVHRAVATVLLADLEAIERGEKEEVGHPPHCDLDPYTVQVLGEDRAERLRLLGDLHSWLAEEALPADVPGPDVAALLRGLQDVAAGDLRGREALLLVQRGATTLREPLASPAHIKRLALILTELLAIEQLNGDACPACRKVPCSGAFRLCRAAEEGGASC